MMMTFSDIIKKVSKGSYKPTRLENDKEHVLITKLDTQSSYLYHSYHSYCNKTHESLYVYVFLSVYMCF